MSDENEIVEAPEVEQTQGEQPEVTAETGETAETTGESATPPGDDATAIKPKKKGVQERIDELTRQRHEKERALDAAKQEAEYWKSQAIQKPATPQPVVEPQSSKPRIEQYENYDDYITALTAHTVSETLAANNAERAQQQRRQTLAEQQKAFNAKGEALDVDDFVEVVYNPDLQLSEKMIEIAFDSDKGPEILYYLGKNPSEAARIAQLSEVQAARELGRLEASMSMPSPKLTSSAPPPIKPITGSGEPPQLDQEKMTPEQWRDWRNEQLRKKGAH